MKVADLVKACMSAIIEVSTTAYDAENNSMQENYTPESKVLKV
jgi:hypothetical protein